MGLEKYIGKIFKAEIIAEDGLFGGEINIPGDKEEVNFIVGKYNPQTQKYEYSAGVTLGRRSVVIRDFEEISRQFYVDVIKDIEEIQEDVSRLPRKLVMLSSIAEIDAEIKILEEELEKYPTSTKTESNRLKKLGKKIREIGDDARRLSLKMNMF